MNQWIYTWNWTIKRQPVSHVAHCILVWLPGKSLLQIGPVKFNTELDKYYKREDFQITPNDSSRDVASIGLVQRSRYRLVTLVKMSLHTLVNVEKATAVDECRNLSSNKIGDNQQRIIQLYKH